MKSATEISRRSAEFGASEAAKLYSKNPALSNALSVPDGALKQNSESQGNSALGDRVEISKEARSGVVANPATRVNLESWGMSSGSQTETQSQKQVASVEKTSSVQRPESPKQVRGSDVDGVLGALNGPSPGEMSIGQSNDAQVVRKTDRSRKTTGFTVTPEQAVVSQG